MMLAWGLGEAVEVLKVVYLMMMLCTMCPSPAASGKLRSLRNSMQPFQLSTEVLSSYREQFLILLAYLY